MWKQIGVLVFAYWLPTCALAEEQGPQIKGTLDGEPQEWFILSQGNDSNASFVEIGDKIRIDIIGFIDDEHWDTQDALSISLTLMEDELTEEDVIFLISHSPLPPLYTSEGGEVTVSLTHYERHSQSVHVVGSIEGVLALQVQLEAPPSLEEGVEIDVQFDIEAQKVEF